MKHLPGGLVTGQAEMPFYGQGRNTLLVGGHQIGGPEPMGQRDLSPVKNRAGSHRKLMAAAGTPRRR